MCSQCFTAFPQRNPPLSVSCPHCDMAHFCNRLCLSKAQSSAHHPLLCPGQNKGALELLKYIHRNAARHLDATAKIVAKWRAGDANVYQRVWEGMARVSLEKKEMERKEWYVTGATGLTFREFVGEQRRKEWRTAHQLLINALNPPTTSPNYKSFQKLVTKGRKSPPSEEELDRWFSFNNFLELLGLASINQEDSGGLYALHAHINHSCEPNLMVRTDSICVQLTSGA